MTEPVPENKEQLIIDLNFVPGWARRPPDARPAGGGDRYNDQQRDGRGNDSRRRDRPERTERRPASGARRPEFRDRPRSDFALPQPKPEPVDERLASLEVTFLPERRGLTPLAHRLGRSGRAYSLFEVAALFLSKPDYYLIKIDAPASLENFSFFQCTECKSVFLDKEAAAAHVFAKHFEKFCKKEVKEVEAPKGNFVCVAKCGLSSILLGPPNYHGYNDKVAEVHRSRFADMPMDAYRKRIETIHDAAVIEKWKEEMCKQTVYQFGENENAVTFTRFTDAESYFREHCLTGAIKESRSVVVSGVIAHAMDPGPLRKVIEEAWQKESRFPLKLSVTLRLAFRHLGLHTFKAAGGFTFVTSVAPSAIDPAHAVEGIREILDFVAAHPGCSKAEMLTQLVPGAVPAAEGAEPVASPELPGETAPVTEPVVKVVNPRESEFKRQVQWLVEKGHVIEFSDGQMAVPATAVARVQMARPKGKGRR